MHYTQRFLPFLFMVSVFLFAHPVHATTNAVFDWAATWGGTNFEIFNSVNVDTDGNSYSAGNFQGTVDFDPGSGTSNATSNGSADSFVLKLDENGDLVWAKTWGSTTGDDAINVAFDSTGDVYVAGRFQGTADFDPGAGSASSTSVGNYDIYFSKFSSDGTFEWVKTWGSTNAESTAFVTVASDDSVYVLSSFVATVDFDPGAGTASTTSAGSNDVAVSKFSSDGTFEWVKRWGGSSSDLPLTHIVFDASGDLYALGSFSTTVDFDPGAGSASTTSAGGTDAFVLKLASDGTFEWVKTWGGTGNDTARSITFDSDGNFFVVGGFSGTVDLDPGAGTSNATSNGGVDMSLMKFSSDGTFEWVKVWGGSSSDFVDTVAVDANDDVYTIGYYESTVDFDPGSGTSNATSNGSSDSFISKFSSDGTFEWVETWGGTGSEFGGRSPIIVDDAIYSGMWWQGTVDFDPSGDTDSHTSNGSWDAGVSRFLLIEPDVTTTVSDASASEDGDTASYSIVLTTPPNEDVTIALTTDDQLDVSPTSVTFTSATWDTAQTIEVTAVDDAPSEETTHTGVITHAATSGDATYDGLSIDSVTITITDNDDDTRSSSHRRSDSSEDGSDEDEDEGSAPEIVVPADKEQLLAELKTKVVALMLELIALLHAQIEETL